MRVIVYGIGAIGGGVAGQLAATGVPVIGIARGAMLDAIRRTGALTVITHQGTRDVPLTCVEAPDRIDWHPDDIIILTMKTQDTEGALTDLRRAGVDRQRIVCMQNGVSNERMALRMFSNVYAAVTMMPAQYTVPGAVAMAGRPRLGLFDLGPAAGGDPAPMQPLAKALDTAGFGCVLRGDAMAGKYGKLLINLHNVVMAALGDNDRKNRWTTAMMDEGRAVLTAAGIASYGTSLDDPRRDEMKFAPLPGVTWVGSSSTQSLARGTGSIETDWLNGEIVLLGRMHGVPTPVNAAFQQVAWKMVAGGIAPGQFPPAEVERLVALAAA